MLATRGGSGDSPESGVLRRLAVGASLPRMWFRPGPRALKHCPNGHEMPMDATVCPQCNVGRSLHEEAPAARDMADATMIFGAPPVIAPPPVPAKPETWVALFEAQSGPEAGRRIEIEPGRWKLGKAPRDESGVTLVLVQDPFMSRDHFMLEAGVAAGILKDLGSTNGTLVRGAKVERHILADGDSVQAGGTTFKVSIRPRNPA